MPEAKSTLRVQRFRSRTRQGFHFVGVLLSEEMIDALIYQALLPRAAPDADVWPERTEDWLKKAGAAFFPTA